MSGDARFSGRRIRRIAYGKRIVKAFDLQAGLVDLDEPAGIQDTRRVVCDIGSDERRDDDRQVVGDCVTLDRRDRLRVKSMASTSKNVMHSIPRSFRRGSTTSSIASAGYARGYGMKTSRVCSRSPRLRISSSTSRMPSIGEGGHLQIGELCPRTIVPAAEAVEVLPHLLGLRGRGVIVTELRVDSCEARYLVQMVAIPVATTSRSYSWLVPSAAVTVRAFKSIRSTRW